MATAVALSVALISLAGLALGCEMRFPASADVTRSGGPTAASKGVSQRLPTGVPTTQLAIFLPRLLEDNSLRLARTARTIPSEEAARWTLQALIDGPDGDERAGDYQYPLSPRTRILDLTVTDGTVSVEFDSEIDRVRGRPFSELAYWSIVFTLTEVPGVRAVALVRAGEPVTEFGFPPVPIRRVATRAEAPAWVVPI